jgi:hypothetical protein
MGQRAVFEVQLGAISPRSSLDNARFIAAQIAIHSALARTSCSDARLDRYLQTAYLQTVKATSAACSHRKLRVARRES